MFGCVLQEVITNEHVVAMMKAAISETDDIPMFVSAALSMEARNWLLHRGGGWEMKRRESGGVR